MAKPVAPRAWNSSFPQRRKPMARSSMRPSPKDSGPKSFKRSTLPQRGKKTKAWESVRAKLKVVFQKAGIVTCEARFEGCWRDDGLGFAHSLKRRLITTDQEMEEVALFCNACHDRAEAMPHQRMADIVRSIIAHRPVPVEKIFE